MKRYLIGGAVTLVLVVVGLAAYGATLDDQKETINRQNEAAENGGFGSGSAGETDVFDLRPGDCITDSFGQDSEYADSSNVVACDSSKARAMVLSLFTVDDSETYPLESDFDSEVEQNCDVETTARYIPSPESWNLGDRTVICIAEL